MERKVEREGRKKTNKSREKEKWREGREGIGGIKRGKGKQK